VPRIFVLKIQKDRSTRNKVITWKPDDDSTIT
jgi:hypothetical protein